MKGGAPARIVAVPGVTPVTTTTTVVNELPSGYRSTEGGTLTTSELEELRWIVKPFPQGLDSGPQGAESERAMSSFAVLPGPVIVRLAGEKLIVAGTGTAWLAGV